MATRKDTRAAKARRLRPLPRPNLPEILGRFAAALSIIETVARAIESVEDHGKLPAIGSEISALRQGVAALQRAYNEVDLAFQNLGGAP